MENLLNTSSGRHSFWFVCSITWSINKYSRTIEEINAKNQFKLLTDIFETLPSQTEKNLLATEMQNRITTDFVDLEDGLPAGGCILPGSESTGGH
ncbi:hypothetical protein DPMN_103866 [Dreissena polymorpha]|uniref:Uncharacterized protein n=1 Tax=Dreissena polymorpha TaxID=45954 RepID=A0A9D4HBX0_DREPO|nr:hypothetical protein DPMN_103866 [Dreissena polymorpha]